MFQLSQEADEWAQGIFKQGPFKNKLDYYYLYLLAGLLSEQSSSIKGKRADLVDYFIDEYKSDYRLIINLLLIVEKKRLAIPDNAKERIKLELLEKYIDAEKNSLNRDGRELCNDYANQGYLMLSEKMPKPADAYQFLTSYMKEIRKLKK